MALSEIGTCKDIYGDVIAVAADGSAVLVTFHGETEPVSMWLEAAHREEFQRLFVEAERQAEASA